MHFFIYSLIILLSCGCISSIQGTQDKLWQSDKRGREAFYGTPDDSHLKEINDASPYYFYEKRGGGRAFVSQWQPLDGFSYMTVECSFMSEFTGDTRFFTLALTFRVARRGGGRAFSGTWQPHDFVRRFYSPFFNKRSPHLWELIDGSSLTY